MRAGWQRPATKFPHPPPARAFAPSLALTLRAAPPCKTAILPFCLPQAGEGNSLAAPHHASATIAVPDEQLRRHNVEPIPQDRWRALRYLVRTPLLLLHILISPPLAVLVLNPVAARIRVGDTTLEKFMIRWWSGALVRRFGLTIRRFGEPLPGAVLYVANHISWLDIELVHSQRPVSFVAKSEIAGWPYVGWLSARAGTIFHRRGNTDSLAAVMARASSACARASRSASFPKAAAVTATRSARSTRAFSRPRSTRTFRCSR